MFAIKFLSLKKNRNIELKRTLKTIASFLKNDLNSRIKVLSDNSSVEIVSGSSIEETGDIVVELLIKKRIIINNDDLNDKRILDAYISNIKYFCEQASKIEEVSYIPLHLRKREIKTEEDK